MMATVNLLGGLLLTIAGGFSNAQSNTAVSSGAIGKCAVWNYPYTLYNNSGATQTVNDGVSVTVDQNRNIGAVNLAGSGALVMSGTQGITLSGSGGEIHCRWDIPYSRPGQINSTDPASVRFSDPVFQAPYSSSYRWVRGSGWSASVTGSFLNGSLNAVVNGNTAWQRFYFRNEAGSCGLLNAPAVPATWTDVLQIPMNSGDLLSYSAVVAYSTGTTCNTSSMTYTLGNAILLLEN